MGCLESQLVICLKVSNMYPSIERIHEARCMLTVPRYRIPSTALIESLPMPCSRPEAQATFFLFQAHATQHPIWPAKGTNFQITTCHF